jgi:uncharacterized membrane protein HdeD (DUF308 family)
MAIRELLASNVFFCLIKGLVNIVLIIYSLFSSSLLDRLHGLGLAAMLTAILGMVRGVADADDWGPKIQNVFPAMVHLICGVLLFNTQTADKNEIYLPLVILFMMEAVVGVILANELKDFFPRWWISLLGVLAAVLLSVLVVPGERLSDANIQPLVGLFLVFESILLFWIAWVERKMSRKCNRPLQELRKKES